MKKKSENSEKLITSLQDLADLAGVSRATASRALNDSPMANEKTKKRLKALAKKHNYSVNRRARNFRLSRTSVVAVVFMLDIKSHQHMSDPFFLNMLGGIADCLGEHDYDLLLAHAPVIDIRDLKGSRIIGQSDGAIIIGQGEQHQQLNELAAADHRIVVWGYPVKDKNYVVVGGDNLSGGYAATRHLLEQGCRKIALFGKTDNPENAARFDGYLNALHDYETRADPKLKFDVPFEMHGAREAVVEIIRLNTELDGVVCLTDVMALAAISAFQELGVRIPEDVAVVGYDDISLAAFSSPPLTTIRQHIHQAGRILVESVLGLINGETVTDTMLPSELVVRKSSGVGPVEASAIVMPRAGPDSDDH